MLVARGIACIRTCGVRCRVFIGSISLIKSPRRMRGIAPARPWEPIGSMHVVSFRFGVTCVSLESTSAARTLYHGVSIVTELAPVEQSSLCNIDHFPAKNSAAEPGFSCYFVGIPIRGGHRSQLAEQDQDQNDDDHEAEPAAPVVAGPIEGTTPDPAEAAQQDDDQDDKQDRADGYERSPPSSFAENQNAR